MKIEVEVKKALWFLPAGWVTGVPVSDDAALAVLHNPLLQSRLITLGGNRLLPLFASRPLEPRQTARGWILLDMPEEYSLSNGPSTVRITVTDTSGERLSTKLTDFDNNANWGLM